MPNSPLTTISNLLPSAASDYVAIFDQNFTQLFREARAIKAVVKEEAKVMEHPVESGAVITDHRIILPVEIELSLILASEDYQSVYKAIRQYYFNATLLVIQTRAGIYENQLIRSLPHEEDPTMFNALAIALSLKQVQFVQAQFNVVPKAPANNAVVKRGVQRPTTVANDTSVAQDTVRYVKGFKVMDIF